MNADTSKRRDTIGLLIRGLRVTPLSFERWAKRFESLGWNRHRPASHSQRHLKPERRQTTRTIASNP
jgi:hypothetical protein